MFAFSKWKSAIKDNQSIVLRYYYRTLINKSRPLFGRGRLLFYFLFLSPRSFVSFLSLAKSIVNGAQKRCYWDAKWGLLQTKNIEILERLQWVVVQSVMRVIMEESELVQREGDVRDEKRTTWVPSWAFSQVENRFFPNQKMTLLKSKITSSPSFLDKIKSATKGIQPFKSVFFLLKDLSHFLLILLLNKLFHRVFIVVIGHSKAAGVRGIGHHQQLFNTLFRLV